MRAILESLPYTDKPKEKDKAPGIPVKQFVVEFSSIFESHMPLVNARNSGYK